MKHRHVDLSKCSSEQLRVWDYIQTRGKDMYICKNIQECDDIFAEIQDLWDEYFPNESLDWGDDWWWTRRYTDLVENWYGNHRYTIVINDNHGTINIK